MTRLGLVAVAGTLMLLGGCMMQNQSAPALMGPSGFGQALTLTATPDVLPRDGSSQSLIRANFRDGTNDAPLSQRRLILSTSSGTLSVTEVVTDAGGNASFTFTSPSLNTPVSSVSVSARVVGDNAFNAMSQTVRVSVIGPDVPLPSFTIAPANPSTGIDVTFDAGATTLGGVACGGACSYSWDFGDGNSGSGELAQHAYTTPGVKTVTLTVSTAQGTSGSTSRSFTVATPPPPVAAFTVSPASPTGGSPAVFNATTSTPGTGTSITQYAWDFGDGGTATTVAPVVSHTYPMGAAGYPVTLVITDSLGRTASVTVAVTVQ